MEEMYPGVKVYLKQGKIIIEDSNVENMSKKINIEVDVEKIKENSCKIVETSRGKLAVCKVKNKIKIYPIDENKKSKCEICGKRYETYPIIFCDNPICIAMFLEEEEKPDGTFRRICKKCRDKEESAKKLVVKG